jgi:hypothetical protein
MSWLFFFLFLKLFDIGEAMIGEGEKNGGHAVVKLAKLGLHSCN